MDGWVVIGTKLDTKQLEKHLKSSERQLRQYEKEAEKLTDKKAKVTPTANASILVATANGNIALKLKSSSPHSSQSLSIDSLIILPPIIASNTKAIQWSIATI